MRTSTHHLACPRQSDDVPNKKIARPTNNKGKETGERRIALPSLFTLYVFYSPTYLFSCIFIHTYITFIYLYLPKTARLAECLLFADDTSIFYSNSNPDHVASVMNSELTKISLWMKSNKLSVNIKKTNYVWLAKWCKIQDKYSFTFSYNIHSHSRLLV